MESGKIYDDYADWLARFEAEHGTVKPFSEDRLSHLETIVPDWGINSDNILRDLVAEVRQLRAANARLLASDQGVQSVPPVPIVRRSETMHNIPDARLAKCEWI